MGDSTDSADYTACILATVETIEAPVGLDAHVEDCLARHDQCDEKDDLFDSDACDATFLLLYRAEVLSELGACLDLTCTSIGGCVNNTLFCGE